MSRIIFVAALLLLPQLGMAQQQLFRYIDKDGRTVYTDTTPPPDAKAVQKKRLGGNFIETSETPYALQVAQQRNPVTLFSGSCGPLCEQARALLNKRGVPFQDIDPSQPDEMKKLKAVSGDAQVPVLTIGSAQMLKGFEEGKWQAALDQAGYPKTPPVRIANARREPEKPVSGAVKVGGTPPPPAAAGGAKSDAKGEIKPADAAAEPKK